MTRMIHETAIIEEGASIAGDARIGAFCVIGGNAVIGAGCVLHSHVVISGHTRMGAGNEIFSHAALGGPPQHLKYKGEETRLEIGDANIIREHATIHRGTAFGNTATVIGNGNMIMTAVHVGHDCIIGNNTLIASDVLLGGHSEIGDHVYFGGGAAVKPFTRIGKHAMLTGISGATADIIPFGIAHGHNALLTGLNVIGLKRHGFPAASITALRRVYEMLFESHEGLFAERLVAAEKAHGGDEHVAHLLQFIRDGESKPLCHAASGGNDDERGE